MSAPLDLVAGGSGFIGSHLVRLLLAEGRRVRVLDDLATGYRRNLDGLEVDFHQADAADPAAAAAACAGVARVYQLAARPSVPWSVEHPKEAEHANHGTTLALLDAAAAAGVESFVFSSSSAIYGDDPVQPKREALAPAPQSPYAEHKLAGERALATAAAPRTVSLRYFNVYGPRQDPSSPYSGVISLFARWARAGERVRYHGDGGQTRDFVYAADVARANYLAGSAAAAGELAQGAVFNIGTGHSVSIRELWEGLCAALGREPGEPELMEPRAGDVRHSSADVSAAAAAFGFHAEVPLAEGLRLTLESIAAEDAG